MSDDFVWFVGIDWATARHQACLVDRDGGGREQREIEHTAAGVQEFVEWLRTRANGELHRVAVAIESPRGALVDTLIELGLAVFAINPKQLDRFRDRHTVAGAKDDRRDALVLADSLRTDRPAFRLVQVDHPLIIQIRALSRAEDDLQVDLNRLTNRVREQVYRLAPGLLTLCTGADEPWFWTLLELVISPTRVTRTRVDRLLREHRIRRMTADDVLAQLHAPALAMPPGVVDAVCTHLSLLLPQIRVLADQRKRCADHVESLLHELETQPAAADGESREHRDVTILRSLPGVGRKVLATMLAEASRPLADRDYRTLRLWAGTAPVTSWSGKRRTQPFVKMRYACNQRLRQAAYHWSRISLQHDPASRAYYQRLRQRGHRHGRALRSVADRLFRILIAMLTKGTLYDPARAVACEQSAVGA
jgi:transposase